MQENYQRFANIYDQLMTEDIPYNVYIDLIHMAVGQVQGKKILDVGCGTGLLSMRLAQLGGRVTGVDLSESMLSIAKARAESQKVSINFKHLPMQEIDAVDTFDLAVIAIDSLNYVTEKQDVVRTLNNLHRALKLGGRLVFDVHSTFKTDVIFMESPFVYDNDEIAYLWHTEPGDMEHSVISDLTFFVRTENGLFERFTEKHVQRTFPMHDYVEMLENAGFQIERIFADWSDDAPDEESERIFFQVLKK